MLWVLRPGQNSVYFDTFLNEAAVFIPWDGYIASLDDCSDRADFRNRVIKEKGEQNRTTISNWAGQLYSFCIEMKKNDFVLVSQAKSHKYALMRITGEYEYINGKCSNLHHKRSAELMINNIPQEIFSQRVRYSLGAFRTLFKVKQEDEVLEAIKKWSGKALSSAIAEGR